ncbi:hypothetical protein [Bacteroides reticulotermitis]|uniref:hypothetical protein n=1 Tax=Bacteroides reticulotermitis TaxID=1133319 RepID=UPI003A8B6A77
MGKMTLEAVVTGIEKINALRTSIAALKEDLKGIRDAGQAKNIAKQLEQMKKELKESQSEVSRLKNAMEQMYNSQNVVEGARKITENTNQASNTFIRFSGSTEELKARLKELNLEYTRLDDAQKLGARGGQLSNEIAMLQAQYDRETQTLRELRREYVNTQKIQDSQEGSINQLRAQILKLNAAYDNLGRSMRNGKPGEEMLASIEKVRVELSAAEQASGRFQRNVGNYASGFNTLGFSVQQVARELPSLTISLQQFFLAISNNLPMVGDELAKAKRNYKAYEDAIKSGATNVQKVAPVWKQLASAIISPQTAFVVGITLITAYGKEIANWGKELFKGKDAIRELYTAQRDLNEVIDSSINQSSKEVTKLNTLYKIATDVTRSTKERNTAVKELKKTFPEHLKNLTDESIKNGKITKAIKEQTAEIIANAKAVAAADQIARNWYMSFQAGVTKNIAFITRQRLEQELTAKEGMVQQLSQMKARPESYVGLADEIKRIKERIKETDTEIQRQDNLQSSYQRSSKALEGLVTASGLRGRGVNESDKEEREAEKLRKQSEKYKVLLDKNALDEIRTTEDLQMQVDEARIKAMDEGSQKTIAEMELNFEKELQAIDRQKEDLLRKKISDAREAFEADPKKKKGESFDGSKITLSDDDTKYFDGLYKAAISNNEKTYSTLVNQYLAYSDERIAIEKKFNDDVAIMQEARKKAEDAGDTDGVAKIDRSISKRNEKFNEDTQALDLEQLKKDLNWEQVFGNLDKVSTNSLKNLKVKLKDFVAQIKNLSPENMRELVDAIEKIDNKVSERNPFESMSVSFKELRDATELAKKAQDDYNKAVDNGTQKEIDNAKATLDNANDKKQKALAESTIALQNGVNEAGQYVDSANQILGIMEAIGIETPEWMNKYMSGVGEMLNGLSSIDLTKPMSIVTGSLQTLKGALTSVVSLGGLIPGLGGADYSRYNEMKDQYDTLNNIWDQLIDKKREYIGISYGSEASKVGREALDLAQKSIDSYRTLGLELLNSGASAGSSSIGKRIRKGMSREGWDQWDSFANSIGMNPDDVGGRMEGLFSLSIEQLEKLKSEAPTFWAKLNDETREYLNSIIEGGERLEEIQEQIKEQLTQVSFDSVFDSFVDTLMDMDSSSKDFANNFEEYMQRAVLTTMVGNKFNSRLQTWYDNFAKANEDKAGITKDEMDKSQAEWDAIVADAVAQRDQLKNLFGWDSSSSSQSASTKGFQAMSQDTGEELNGRFTALQAAGEEIKRLNMEQTMSLKEFAAKMGESVLISSDTRDIAEETRNILTSTYLETVEIRQNTSAIIKPIKDMAADIAEVKRNTKGLASR